MLIEPLDSLTVSLTLIEKVEPSGWAFVTSPMAAARRRRRRDARRSRRTE
jgi:hypothetical protein